MTEEQITYEVGKLAPYIYDRIPSSATVLDYGCTDGRWATLWDRTLYVGMPVFPDGLQSPARRAPEHFFGQPGEDRRFEYGFVFQVFQQHHDDAVLDMLRWLRVRCDQLLVIGSDKAVDGVPFHRSPLRLNALMSDVGWNNVMAYSVLSLQDYYFSHWTKE